MSKWARTVVKVSPRVLTFWLVYAMYFDLSKLALKNNKGLVRAVGALWWWREMIFDK